MKTPAAAKQILTIAFALLLNAFSFASAKSPEVRDINIAGLIFNSETLSPIDSATIYDSGNNILGTTDKNGYFKVTISYNKPGEIYFGLRIVKHGFQKFIRREHWGNLSGKISSIMYFGLNGSAAKAFSSSPNSIANSNDLSYDNVLRNFDKVKEEKTFNDKLAKAKADNQDVFIQIDNQFYLVNNTGWIKLTSETDLVAIDKKNTVAANKLNTVIKRNSVKWMTPVSGKAEKFALYTR
ncbi:MAG: hypothetical protein WC615_03660 [Mucilaginibacter sp.]|jgi:hypothetical protein|uniref:hypothetical protein n=1 Tax=Mucilaginibacter sp. TaxID=1882438 RepID=UPI003569CC0D